MTNIGKEDLRTASSYELLNNYMYIAGSNS